MLLNDVGVGALEGKGTGATDGQLTGAGLRHGAAYSRQMPLAQKLLR